MEATPARSSASVHHCLPCQPGVPKGHAHSQLTGSRAIPADLATPPSSTAPTRPCYGRHISVVGCHLYSGISFSFRLFISFLTWLYLSYLIYCFFMFCLFRDFSTSSLTLLFHPVSHSACLLCMALHVFKLSNPLCPCPFFTLMILYML